MATPEPATLVAFGNAFSVIRKMRIVAIDRPTLKTLALAAALPMLPIVLLVTPADAIVHTVLKMLY